jgi:PBP1b-binding outer membrane lipoprotein LpoB
MSIVKINAVVLVAILWFAGCTKAQVVDPPAQDMPPPKPETVAKIQNPGRVIHVLVALCQIPEDKPPGG